MKLAIFDLDGTLTESKQPLTSEMAALVTKLLALVKVAVISGGALPQFLKQVVAELPNTANLANLYILPTCGAALYEFQNGDWNKIYEERLSEKEADTIETAMRAVAAQTGLINFSEPAYGERIEYRGGQVSMSALGQEAPLVEKKMWDPDHTKRRALQENIAARLPEFSVGMGGATTIDVTKRNIDKAYGIRQLCKRLGIEESDALYVGDELEAGGNDEAVYKTAAETKSVKDPTETARFIENILKSNFNTTA
ncbi:MAG: HAD-IIB family hydrolase [Candidatus Kaiserbacteria bacterium]|nr:HAD-IIB family hydrolase [Candidatus Kaiserbacteria bacterium]